MSEALIWHVGNRDPSISETLVDENNNPVDLTGVTVRFKARETGSSTLLVDQPVTIVTPPGTDGQVRYDWSAADIGASGILAEERLALVWWEVTRPSGKKQDYLEAVIEVRAHSPETLAYVELEEFKSTAELTGMSFADRDAQRVLVAASRAVDSITGTRFYPDADANQVRYYTADGRGIIEIDDLLTLTSLSSDYDGSGTFEETWTVNTDFTLEPLNAVLNGRPYDTIRIHPRSTYRFSRYPRSLRVTGKFGWTEAPEGVKTATTMIAARLLKEMREAPLGVIGLGLEGTAVRISRFMPGVEMALAPYTKSQVLA